MSEVTRCPGCFELSEFKECCPNCGFIMNSPPKELSQLFPGTELMGRYIIGTAVGFGGFGVTYKAWDKKHEHIVAVKEYYPSGIASRIPGKSEVMIYAKKRENEYYYGKQRFLDEARNMAKFSNEPNIINIYEYFEENNTAYIIMEFLDGISLSAFMHMNDGKIDVDEGIEIAHSIGSALTKIHEKGIVHRDVSPDNIFLCIDGRFKLIDFGAARFSQDEHKQLTIILKPGFAPPEQYEKINEQGPWTDVYALGATLYYALTGVKPEESTNRKINDTLPYPHTLDPDIPENISFAIMKAMALERRLRYDNVQEFLDAIGGVKKVIPVEIEKKKLKFRRAVSIGAAAAVIVTGAILAGVKWNQNKNEETLAPCSIEVRYLMSGDLTSDAEKKEALESIVSDFTESFPDVSVDLVGYGVKNIGNMNYPGGIFECTGNVPETAISLKNVYRSDEAKECSFLKKSETVNALPLGFVAPSIYENFLIDTDTSSANMITDNIKLAEILGIPVTENAMEIFTSGKSTQYAGMTDSYTEISASIPIKVLPIESDVIMCEFTNIWAAAGGTENEKKAELRLLEFMLTNNAQDAIHLRGADGCFPINDSTLLVYTQVYDDFEDFFENRDNYQFREVKQ